MSSSADPAGAETILVVDDEPLVRSVIRRILMGAGYRVLEAPSAQAARELLGADDGRAVRLVLLDNTMPGENGSAAVPSLRALTTCPIALVSGMAPSGPIDVTAVIEKPIRAEDLVRRVRALLDGHRND
jgi:DNA-binding response OmpR family regulator